MNNKNTLLLLFVVAFTAISIAAVAQSPTVVRERTQNFKTYPFSDPDPVANFKIKGRSIYPYFRFDGFTDVPEQKDWKVVELENDFIKVVITPEIGGKIWTAIEKKSGKSFLYDNDVVKFRDIAMRGAWTSGGIEINYGIIGHTPAVATPVDYKILNNEDGSASCILSLLDRLTNTRWSLEVRLPKDKAYFITRSFWHNGTDTYQPYYTWMNMAGKAADDLEFVFPGDHYIGHDGSSHAWPYDENNGKHIALYNQNNFGGSKSYHIAGTYSEYYGAFWQNENFGMIHYAPRQDKIGRKIFLWGLSRQGMIWEDILSDNAGQYVEMQSGRLFNQNGGNSVLTPFKQFHFMPYSTDTWSEYWYPFQNTEGILDADLTGVYNLKKEGDKTTLYLSPVSYIKDTLKVIDFGGNTILKEAVDLKPLQSFQQEIRLGPDQSIRSIKLANSNLRLQDNTEKVLGRPMKSDSTFDWKSAYGFYLKGKYASGTRDYETAEKYIRESLGSNIHFIPALTEMSYLQYRKMNYDSAYYYAREALSVDTYDPAANYYYGLSALKLDKRYDAEDGFEIAAITPQFRSAAYTKLSEVAINNKNYEKALKYAEKALVNNSENITALQLQMVASRILQRGDYQAKQQIINLDPLNHFVRFEAYWRNKTNDSKQQFTDLIRDEMPEQTYLDLAIWYYNIGRLEESKAILSLCPVKNDELFYWLAYLNKNDADRSALLREADEGDPYFVFPYRPESKKVMEWAIKNTDNWRPQYYLSLMEQFLGHQDRALKRLDALGDTVPFAPLYITRARLLDQSENERRLTDLRKAVEIDHDDWRYGQYLAMYLVDQQKKQEALTVIKPYFENNPNNFIVGMDYVKILMLNNQYPQAEGILDKLHVLPYEGAREGHQLYKQIKLVLALELLKNKHYKQALNKVKESFTWPEHLGVGKPYDSQIDTTMQNEIVNLIETSAVNRSIDERKMDQYLNKVKEESVLNKRVLPF